MKRRIRSFVVMMGIAGIAVLAHAESPVRLGVSGNGHYLVEAANGKPFFLLADTAWNLDALTDAEIDRYLIDRDGHGFNAVMFCLDFSPQASAENAYGQVAYTGDGKSELSRGLLLRMSIGRWSRRDRWGCMRWCTRCGAGQRRGR